MSSSGSRLRTRQKRAGNRAKAPRRLSNDRRDPRFDFSELDTYRWHPDQRVEAELEQHLQLVVAVQRRMAALGYRIDIREPDLCLQYRFDIGETPVPAEPSDPGPFECTDEDCEEEAWAYLFFGLIAALAEGERTIEHLELTITIVDAETNWEIYRATGVFPWSEDESEWILNQAVRELLKTLPPSGRPS